MDESKFTMIIENYKEEKENDEFEGEYYRNMYVHYKLKNWEYESNT